MISWVRNDQISTPFYTSPKVVLPRKPPYETPWLTTNPMDLPSIKILLAHVCIGPCQPCRKTVCFPWFFTRFQSFWLRERTSSRHRFWGWFQPGDMSCGSFMLRIFSSGFEKKGKPVDTWGASYAKSHGPFSFFLGGRFWGGGKTLWEVENKQNIQKTSALKSMYVFFLRANFWKGKVRDL